MQCIRIDAYGGPEVLRWRDVPIPEPGPGQVLVRLAYSGVNFMDVHTRQGKYADSRNYTTTLPLTLGIEGSGRVESVGPGVDDWHPGDRVAYCLVRGSYADYAVVPANRLVPVSDDVSLADAAAVLFQGLTAHYLAHDVGNLRPRMTCLVHAGSGGIGQLLIQFAKLRGANVAATVSTPEKARIARQRGADAVFLYDEANRSGALKGFTGGAGFDVVFDSVGPATFSTTINALRRRGLFVFYGSNSGRITGIDPMALADSGSLYFTRPRLADYVREDDVMRRRAGEIFRNVASGELDVDIEHVYDLETVPQGHAALAERRSIGKSILRIHGE